MPTKSRFGFALISVAIALIAISASALGAYYGTTTKVAVVEQGLVMLRADCDDHKRMADKHWDQLSAALQLLDQRGVRNETKIDAVLTMLRDSMASTRP